MKLLLQAQHRADNPTFSEFVSEVRVDEITGGFALSFTTMSTLLVHRRFFSHPLCYKHLHELNETNEYTRWVNKWGNSRICE